MKVLKGWLELFRIDLSGYTKKRNNIEYLPWANCLKLLYEHGAEKVEIIPQTTESGSSLFMSDQTFGGKDGPSNRCYEVRLRVNIDDKSYEISYPVLNGISPVTDKGMNQNAVHKAQMRAFVKCVAINTGLGFNLWADDSDIDDKDSDDLSKHSIWAIRERMQNQCTALVKKGLATKEIAQKVGIPEQTLLQYYLGGVFDEIARVESEMAKL